MSKNTDLARSYDLKAPIASPVFTGDLRAERLIANGNGGVSTNVAVGHYSLASNTTGGGNIAVGTSALQGTTSGWENVAIGVHSLHNNNTGVQNTALGRGTLFANTIGGYNVALGANSLASNSSGYHNVSVGSYALGSNTIGTANIGIGSNSLRYKQDGSDNTDFSRCLGLGDSTKVGGNYATAIGYNASAPASCVALGTSSERTLVGGGADNGVDKLQVNGSISFNSPAWNTSHTVATDAESGTAFTTTTNDFKYKVIGGVVHYTWRMVYTAKSNGSIIRFTLPHTPIALLGSSVWFGSSSTLLNADIQHMTVAIYSGNIMMIGVVIANNNEYALRTPFIANSGSFIISGSYLI